MTKIIRDLAKTEWNAPEIPERYLFDLRSECNLACPMCLLHGAPDTPEKEAMIGKMSVERAKQVLDEIMDAKPLVQPSMWGEPLLAKDLRQHITNMKERGIAVALNTNGLTLKEETARFFVEIKLDSIFFSLDATTPETLKKVRGVDKLAKIEKNLLMMLRVRDEMKSVFPRVGATMTIQKANVHEHEDFLKRWMSVVDVIRTSPVFEDGHLNELAEPEKRVPCGMIYHTMPIHFNGDVSLCCFDSHGQAIMGNVFKDGGVKAVWNGEKFREARRIHETGEFDKLPFCKNCNAWAGAVYTEQVEEVAGVRVLVRRSPQFNYYNRLDRLESWHEHMRGHAALDRSALEKMTAQ